MIPCGVKEKQGCKPSYETRHGTKGTQSVTQSVAWEDFQDGPSFVCPERSYAFDFQVTSSI